MRNPIIRIALAMLLALPVLQVTSQELTGEFRAEMIALLDSSDYYELRAPARAVEFAMAFLQQVPDKDNERLCIRALLTMANCMKMQSRTQEGLNFTAEAISLSHRIADPVFLIRSCFMRATVYDHIDNQDSCLVYYQTVIDLYNQHHPDDVTYYVALSYCNVGQVLYSIGSYQKAEEYVLKGYQISKASAYARMFALSQVISYYGRMDDPRYLPYLDTLAMSDFFKKSTPESFMAHFDTFLMLEDASDAEKERKLREVYAYSVKNSSLINQVGFGTKLYEALVAQGKYDEGRHLLLELLDKSKEVGNMIFVAGTMRRLYENSKAAGETDEALRFLEGHSHLRDSLLSVENLEKINTLNIKFETAQKDHEIAQQKVRLETGRRNRNFLVILALALTSLVVMIFIFFRNKARTARRLAEQDRVIHEQERQRMIRETELAELTASLETEERERNRIARDLHDGLGSLMSGISAQVEFLRSLPEVSDVGSVQLNRLREMVKDATSDLRRTSHELMPVGLLRHGLESAVSDLCMNLLVRNGIEPQFEFPEHFGSLSQDEELILYRIVQELLNNIVRHARATQVLLQFTRFEDDVSLVVEDNGVGFNVSDLDSRGGLGLGSLKSRLDLLKGVMDIASSPGDGTTVTINYKTSAQ